MNKIVTLEILDFDGYGGEHLYGSLHGYKDGQYKTVRLSYPLNRSQAQKINKKDRSKFPYKAGQKTERFFKEEDIRNVAIECWKKEFPNALALNIGHSGIADPQEMLAGPKELVLKVNKLYEARMKSGGYEIDEKACTIIFKAYQKLLKKYE